ncbi:hypothetical protein DR64_8079 [Paraburkholderia xenovorans LB400]|nr:hypothetical protein DR64_8079 [Paraburkholderia xenovorans LB400]
MIRTLLSDDAWKRVEAILPGKDGDRGGTATDNRWFVEAVLWIGHTGGPWRDLPAEFGRWHPCKCAFPDGDAEVSGSASRLRWLGSDYAEAGLE